MGHSSKYKDWIKPSKALARAKAHFGDAYTAAEALGERLKDGLLGAMAETIVYEEPGKPETTTSFAPLAKVVWRHVTGGWHGQMFWRTGNLEVWLDRGEDRCSLHGILFDPEGLDKFLGAEARPAPPAVPDSPPEPEQKGPRVPEPLLKEWFAVYSKAYAGTEDTEDRAVESARGMFPGKSVSRERVRILRGARKRGPKPKTAE
jgi:hypothetical protein